MSIFGELGFVPALARFFCGLHAGEPESMCSNHEV
jgi:hypothetical protein